MINECGKRGRECGKLGKREFGMRRDLSQFVTPDIEKMIVVMPSNAKMRNATANGGQL